MFNFRFEKNDNRQRYRKQILFFFEKLQLCFIDVVNDLYDKIFQTNKNDKNCFIYRNALKTKKIIFENVNF